MTRLEAETVEPRIPQANRRHRAIQHVDALAQRAVAIVIHQRVVIAADQDARHSAPRGAAERLGQTGAQGDVLNLAVEQVACQNQRIKRRADAFYSAIGFSCVPVLHLHGLDNGKRLPFSHLVAYSHLNGNKQPFGERSDFAASRCVWTNSRRVGRVFAAQLHGTALQKELIASARARKLFKRAVYD